MKIGYTEWPEEHQTLAELCARVYRRSEQTHCISEVEVMVDDSEWFLRLIVAGTEASGVIPKNFKWSEIKASASNVRDIFRDLRFWRMKTPHGRVHRGFYLSAKRWVDKYAHQLPRKPIILSGHSKGAAEASLIAEMLRDLGKPIVQVVLFGEPSSRSKSQRDHYQSLGINTVSYINRKDWVRFTPPWDNPCVKRTQLEDEKGHSIHSYIKNIKRTVQQ